MVATKYAPLAAFILVIVKNSVCTGFSSPITTNQSTTQHHDARSLHRRPRRCEFDSTRNSVPNTRRRLKDYCHHHAISTTSLTMGLFDFIQENFLDSREDDFIPLEKGNDDTFGPGPLILMYAVPDSMDDNELKDMVEDGMPGRVKEGVVIRRLSGMNMNGAGGDELLDASVGEALDKAMTMKSSRISAVKPMIVVSSPEEDACPVLYFSGVSNTEMMDTYGIIANEIYEETNGVHWPACAKVVPPAMDKSMRRVLLEISGDHADAMRIRREEAEKTDER